MMAPLTLTPAAFDLLHDIIGNGHRADRHARMRPKGSTKKYTHVKRYKDEHDRVGEHLAITDEEIYDHILGEATYAAPLIGDDGLASAGLIELDKGGQDAASLVLEAAAVCGVTMFVTLVKDADDHYGPHCWALFNGRYAPEHIVHLLRKVANVAGCPTAEIWPCNENIRLPWGLHTWSQSRGDTILPTGEVYHNDDPDELNAAIRAVSALSRNPRPPAPPKVEPVKPKGKTTNGVSLGGNPTGQEIACAFNQANRLSALLKSLGSQERRVLEMTRCEDSPEPEAEQLAFADRPTVRPAVEQPPPPRAWAPYHGPRRPYKQKRLVQRTGPPVIASREQTRPSRTMRWPGSGDRRSRRTTPRSAPIWKRR
jgi:hypothetical protein